MQSKENTMNDVIANVTTFIANNSKELAIGSIVVLVAFAIILLIILIRRKPDVIIAKIQEYLSGLQNRQDRLELVIKDEITRNRQETAKNAQQARQELGTTLKYSSDSLQQRMSENVRLQKDQLDSFSQQLMAMTKLNDEKLNAMRKTMADQLQAMQADNTKKLEQMRATVDEKLHSTLEKRLGESFKQVSERLEQVYKGLGEMRSLATGVGDLKKVLTNVKTRGTWGEIRLSVEFAIKLPGQDQDHEKIVWMPIDSKFPQEDYQRLMDAQEAADKEQAERSIKNLETRIKAEAKHIKEKYLDPPNTTDFGIMFLPVEGLYAEVLRRPGLCDTLQREYRIVVTGPTTLAALLNSLQMGFRTLAIEKRSSEVWELLGAVKTEFGKFGAVLAKTKKKLQEASNTIDKAEVRTRAIERKLRFYDHKPVTSNRRTAEQGTAEYQS
jgi:DNA recombination protein RmuC